MTPIGISIDNGDYLYNKKVIQYTSTSIKCDASVMTGYYVNKENS